MGFEPRTFVIIYTSANKVALAVQLLQLRFKGRAGPQV
jgi:hypothetical protein